MHGERRSHGHHYHHENSIIVHISMADVLIPSMMSHLRYLDAAPLILGGL